MKFSGVTLGYGKDINKEENMEFTLKPGEEKEIETRRLNIKPQLAFRYDNSAYIQRLNKIKREVNK